MESFSPVRLIEPNGDATTRLRERGTYLVTGGLTGVGYVLASCLAEWCQANLVLVGRTPLPDRSEWAESPQRGKRRSREPPDPGGAGAGGERCAGHGGCRRRCRSGSMQNVLRDARSRFGPIHGVVHAAGVTAGGLMAIQSPDRPWPSFGPKLEGARVLERLLSQEQLDFFVLCSSLNAVEGRTRRGGLLARRTPTSMRSPAATRRAPAASAFR